MRFSWSFLILFAFGVASANPGGTTSNSTAAVGVAGRCEEPAVAGGGAEGCYWNTSLPLGRTGPQLYWYIDRFADVTLAKAARTERGAVIVGLGGHVFLQTVSEDPEWRSQGGERLGRVGPLAVPRGVELTARFMEATTSSASATHPHVHSGPEGFFLLEGSICVETPAGTHRAGPSGSVVLPGRLPMQLFSPKTVRRSLVLVVHPTAEPWIDRRPNWKGEGLCEKE